MTIVEVQEFLQGPRNSRGSDSNTSIQGISERFPRRSQNPGFRGLRRGSSNGFETKPKNHALRAIVAAAYGMNHTERRQQEMLLFLCVLVPGGQATDPRPGQASGNPLEITIMIVPGWITN